MGADLRPWTNTRLLKFLDLLDKEARALVWRGWEIGDLFRSTTHLSIPLHTQIRSSIKELKWAERGVTNANASILGEGILEYMTLIVTDGFPKT